MNYRTPRRTRLFTLIFTVFLLLPGARALPQTDAMRTTVKAQAEGMVAAFMKEDWKTFDRFSNPVIIKMAGGPASMEQVMRQAIDTMKKMGVIIKKIRIGEASRIVKYDTELQCTIPQTSDVSTPKGMMFIRTTLVGISSDGGKTWTFLDAVNKDAAAVKRVWPHLSPEIVIPPTERGAN